MAKSYSYKIPESGKYSKSYVEFLAWHDDDPGKISIGVDITNLDGDPMFTCLDLNADVFFAAVDELRKWRDSAVSSLPSESVTSL